MESWNNIDVIIVGAGASGLSAALELTKAGKQVLILEARDRIGGRIHTIKDSHFSQPIEGGAEFIHGELPVTLSLLKEAGIGHETISGKSWMVKRGSLQKDHEFIEGWDLLIKRLKALQEDQSLESFLNTHFSGEKFNELRTSTLQYAEGYNAADPKKASALALKDEWDAEDEEHQYRVKGGYGSLLDNMKKSIERNGGRILLGSAVRQIKWGKQHVEVTRAEGKTYTSKQVLVTIPIGVLQSNNEKDGGITFSPTLPEYQQAIQQMGYGSAIKIIIQFRNQFWEDHKIHHRMPGAGFIFSDAFIPTWWTQNPNENGLLTGWLAGPKANALKETPDEQIFEKAIDSLCYIFNTNKQYLEQNITGKMVFNWAAQPFSLGAYTYATLGNKEAIKVLSQPVENTIFFGGEAIFDGTVTGTVEVALSNGIETARKICSYKQE